MHSESKVNTRYSEIAKAPHKVSEARRTFKVMFSRWLVVLGAVIILTLIVVAIFAPLVAPYDPVKQDLSIALQQPSGDHLLGTDWLGRDVLSRIIYGTRVSIMVGVIAVGIACIIGMSLGLVAGYFGRWTNNLIMRIIDVMMSLPPLVLALAISLTAHQVRHLC